MSVLDGTTDTITTRVGASPLERQCARCRALFPAELDADGVLRDWWLCDPCHAVLLPGKRTL